MISTVHVRAPVLLVGILVTVAYGCDGATNASRPPKRVRFLDLFDEAKPLLVRFPEKHSEFSVSPGTRLAHAMLGKLGNCWYSNEFSEKARQIDEDRQCTTNIVFIQSGRTVCEVCGRYVMLRVFKPDGTTEYGTIDVPSNTDALYALHETLIAVDPGSKVNP
jgi:hypothetical protein